MHQKPCRRCPIGIPMLLGALALAPAANQSPAVPASAVPTFECIGLYWSPEAGSASTECTVRYRAKSTRAWREALPLWYDARNKEYRGSIVSLRPGTTYEIRLAL